MKLKLDSPLKKSKYLEQLFRLFEFEITLISTFKKFLIYLVLFSNIITGEAS